MVQTKWAYLFQACGKVCASGTIVGAFVLDMDESSVRLLRKDPKCERWVRSVSSIIESWFCGGKKNQSRSVYSDCLQ